MNAIIIIVVFLLAHAASPSVVALGYPSFGNFGSSQASHPAGIPPRPPERSAQSEQARTEARVRKAQRTKENAMSMLQKFQERLDRYGEFLGKVESRKQKLADKGTDITRMTAFLATARTNLAAARTALAAARTGIEQINYSGEPQAIRTAIRTQLDSVRQAMRTLHTSMSEAVRAALHATAGGGRR